MRIGIIIPDRGDRPELLENCLRMIKTQTIQPCAVELVNHAPNSKSPDITERYRIGYDRLRNKNLDVIAFMENDDWYSPDYLATMISHWITYGKPTIFGTNYTYYYHIKLFQYFTMYHDQRSSAMSTLIKPDLYFPWCPDNEPFTDIYLWQKFGNQGQGTIFKPEKTICMGMKHGVGLCGGKSHVDRLNRYEQLDTDKSFLKNIMKEDPKSFQFYSNYFQNGSIVKS